MPEIVAAQTKLAQEETKLNFPRAELEKKQAEFQTGLTQYQNQSALSKQDLPNTNLAEGIECGSKAEYDTQAW